eukprot:TRINITY_DN8453_c0_g1_i5.p2 TRINITY_DN8453_c0_g1~~TRINITY_DN8453_c0_g1_i5.p2  ORF type:complete len:183 (-),score=36.83 TRINITY_DN8453_c0_g1_i5:177-725(-)
MVTLILFKLCKRLFVNPNSTRSLKERTDIADIYLKLSFQVTYFLRPLFFLFYTKAIWNTLSLYAKILYRSKEILSLLFGNLLLFALLARVIFHDTAEEKNWFPNVAESMYQLILLQTNANFPDVMLDVYQENKTSFFFFLLFIIIQSLILVNLLVAFFYYHYNREIETTKAQIMRQETSRSY